VVNADEESKLYVANAANLGQYNPSGDRNIQVIKTPLPLRDSSQGYWASPAYWKYTDQNGTHYMLYYSATDQTAAVQSLPVNGYQLLTSGSSGPIPSTYASTSIVFCPKSPTPSLSLNVNVTGSGTGIVWAIENGNSHNPGPPLDCNGTRLHMALHAFDASNLATELYSSRGVTTTTSYKATFTTPTVFQGRVYVGSLGEVNVFGLCPQSGCLP
jgi:hypothetical protein